MWYFTLHSWSSCHKKVTHTHMYIIIHVKLFEKQSNLRDSLSWAVSVVVSKRQVLPGVIVNKQAMGCTVGPPPSPEGDVGGGRGRGGRRRVCRVNKKYYFYWVYITSQWSNISCIYVDLCLFMMFFFIINNIR